MLKIRLQKVGRKHEPQFRVIVTESQNAARRGVPVEIVGNYDAKQGKRALKADRIQYWMSHGAQASDTVHNMLVSEGVIKGKKINSLPKKTAIKKEVEETKGAEKSEDTTEGVTAEEQSAAVEAEAPEVENAEEKVPEVEEEKASEETEEKK